MQTGHLANVRKHEPNAVVPRDLDARSRRPSLESGGERGASQGRTANRVGRVGVEALEDAGTGSLALSGGVATLGGKTTTRIGANLISGGAARRRNEPHVATRRTGAVRRSGAGGNPSGRRAGGSRASRRSRSSRMKRGRRSRRGRRCRDRRRRLRGGRRDTRSAMSDDGTGGRRRGLAHVDLEGQRRTPARRWGRHDRKRNGVLRRADLDRRSHIARLFNGGLVGGRSRGRRSGRRWRRERTAAGRKARRPALPEHTG